MKKFIIGLSMLSILGCKNNESQQKVEKISLEKIQEMFSNMKANGINTDTTMLWGYFFTSDKKDSFEQVVNELKSQKFEFVEIYQSEDGTYWLHLERKETHNAKSLFQIDEELYLVADKYKVNYDGFDVGNLDKDKAIERDTYAVPEEFGAVDYQKENYPVLLVGNTAFDRFPHKEEFKYFIKVTTAYKNDGTAMLPTNEELEELDKFELFVEHDLTQNEIRNYYVFRETHKGSRVFYIVTNDSNGATKVIESIKNSGQQRPFHFEIVTDKDWKLYDGFRKKLPRE